MSDVNNIPTHMDALITGGASGRAVGLESRLVKRYASAADRTTRDGSPIAGELGYRTDVKKWEGYDGTNWVVPSSTVIAYGIRTTASPGATTTELGVIRLDNIPVIIGRRYRIWTSPLNMSSTVANDLMNAHIRYNSVASPGAGSPAITTSTQLTGLVEGSFSAGGSQRTQGLNVSFAPGATGTLSVLLSVSRDLGTGTVSINGAPIYPIELVVEDMGVDPGNTGILL